MHVRMVPWFFVLFVLIILYFLLDILLPVSVCWFVSRITEKLLNAFL